MFRKLIVTLAILAPGALAAQTFTASNGHTVTPVDSKRFEVAGQLSSSDKSYWCAASEYVRVRLGNPSDVRLTVVAPPGSLPSGARNVGFSVAADAAKGAAARNSISVRNTGVHISPRLAAQFCEDLIRQNNGL